MGFENEGIKTFSIDSAAKVKFYTVHTVLVISWESIFGYILFLVLDFQILQTATSFPKLFDRVIET